MFYVGRFLQLVGLGISGLGCLVAFDPDTPERTFWAFFLIGGAVFLAGHWLLKR